MGADWRWKIHEAIDRLRNRYEFIGRATGYPFLAVVYPPELEVPVLAEWHTQTEALRPGLDVRHVDVLAATQLVLAEIGTANVVDSLRDPMPGSDPQEELGHLWVQAAVQQVHEAFSLPRTGRLVVSVERLAALFPAAGPLEMMQKLWDSSQEVLNGPVVFMIPGQLEGARHYSFLGSRSEFMYRGDLL